MTDSERLAAIEVLTDSLDRLEASTGRDYKDDDDAWSVFTGLPASTLPSVLEWALVTKKSPVELLVTVAGIAFQHGRDFEAKRATESAKSASDSAS